MCDFVHADSKYLNQLEELTRKYAWYADYGIGLAGLPFGLLWLGSGLALVYGEIEAAQVLAALSTPILVTVARPMYHWYQRHGVVWPPGLAVGERWLYRFLAVAVPLAFLVNFYDVITRRSFPGLPHLSLGILWALVAVIVGVSLWEERARPRRLMNPLVMLQLSIAFTSSMKTSFGGMAMLVTGVGYVAIGAWSHWRYQRIEQRLMRLRTLAGAA